MRDYRPKIVRGPFSPKWWQEFWLDIWTDRADHETRVLRSGQQMLLLAIVAGIFTVIFSVLGWDHEVATAFLILGSAGALICFVQYSVMLAYKRWKRWQWKRHLKNQHKTAVKKTSVETDV